MAFLLLPACGRTQKAQVLDSAPVASAQALLTGAERTAEYVPSLSGQRVAVVTNQTGRVGQRHLVDTLLALKVNITKVFAPEHGFRGDADAGEHVHNGVDSLTKLPLVSLYGDNKKPTAGQLADVDLFLFDIQDVGVRFYTYISTLHYIMEAAVEHKKKVVVLDRPNPNGFYVDGPVLDPAFKSFVGMHPVPLVHGMTIGEYAGMINGEGWLKGGKQCDMRVIPCSGYTHDMKFVPPIRPSPNLPNGSSIWLYPSLGLFEGTIVSVGRGTEKPFQCIGYPGCPIGRYRFTPQAMPGAKNPPYLGKECSGLDLRDYGAFQSRMEKRINLQWLIGMYHSAPDTAAFFSSFFDKLAGGTTLREQIVSGAEEDAIRNSWKPGLEAFRALRAKYLLYPDFAP
ncbi:MAG TPA: DUF1343 domain-containing protein [Flavobacteriales bacterium]|nr:DUF1343 domain-containing protein [Flavobacteriales bacterium]